MLGARAGDLLGRRRMFIVGLGLFTLASLAIGLAQSAAWLLGARAVQGVGAAILAPSTLALLSTNFPEGPARTRALGWYGRRAFGCAARRARASDRCFAHRVGATAGGCAPCRARSDRSPPCHAMSGLQLCRGHGCPKPCRS